MVPFTFDMPDDMWLRFLARQASEAKRRPGVNRSQLAREAFAAFLAPDIPRPGMRQGAPGYDPATANRKRSR